MAVRLLYLAAGMVVGVAIGTAIVISHASDVDDAAAEAGVNAEDLRGAVNTTGLEPRAYLIGVGELARPLPPAPPIRPVWDLLAQCESGGNWHNASNPVYKGGLQFDAGTWARHGGLAFAPRADFATREQQVLVGERTLASQGWQAWPACSRRLGLR